MLEKKHRWAQPKMQVHRDLGLPRRCCRGLWMDGSGGIAMKRILSALCALGFAGVWAPNDASGDEFEVVTIDTDNSLRKLSVNWLDKAVPHKPRSCRLNFRDYARQ